MQSKKWFIHLVSGKSNRTFRMRDGTFGWQRLRKRCAWVGATKEINEKREVGIYKTLKKGKRGGGGLTICGSIYPENAAGVTMATKGGGEQQCAAKPTGVARSYTHHARHVCLLSPTSSSMSIKPFNSLQVLRVRWMGLKFLFIEFILLL